MLIAQFFPSSQSRELWLSVLSVLPLQHSLKHWAVEGRKQLAQSPSYEVLQSGFLPSFSPRLNEKGHRHAEGTAPLWSIGAVGPKKLWPYFNYLTGDWAGTEFRHDWLDACSTKQISISMKSPEHENSKKPSQFLYFYPHMFFYNWLTVNKWSISLHFFCQSNMHFHIVTDHGFMSQQNG